MEARTVTFRRQWGQGKQHPLMHIPREVYEVALRSVTNRIMERSTGHFDKEEAEGWSQLGIAHASMEFEPERYPEPTYDPAARLCAYLIHRGYCRTIDALRSARLLGRFRNGRLYGASMDLPIEDNLGDRPRDPVDYRELSVEEHAYIAEITYYVETELKGSALRVFDLHFMQGYSIRDVAVMLGVTFTRVYQLRVRIINHLRQKFGGSSSPLIATLAA